jgi:hypothetical protein
LVAEGCGADVLNSASFNSRECGDRFGKRDPPHDPNGFRNGLFGGLDKIVRPRLLANRSEG